MFIVLLCVLVSGTDPNYISPLWLTTYANWHHKNRLNTQVPQLIYHCDTSFVCGGIGDRFKGIISSFYAAVHLQRLFFVYMPTPVSLESIFNTSEINWRIPSDRPNCTKMISQLNVVPQWLQHFDSTSDPWGKTKVVCVRLNTLGAFFDRLTLNFTTASYTNNAMGAFASAAFRTLFRPQKRVEDAVQQIQQSASLPTLGTCFRCQTPFWLGVHIRTDDTAFRTNVVNSRASSMIGNIALCIRNIVDFTGNISVYVASDSYAVKQRLMSDLPFIKTTELKPTHYDQQQNDHVSTWAELLVLANAPCLLAAKRSGYSNLASWLRESFGDTTPRCFIVGPNLHSKCNANALKQLIV